MGASRGRGRPRLNAATLKMGNSTLRMLRTCAEGKKWRRFDAIAAAFVRISLHLDTTGPLHLDDEGPMPGGVADTEVDVMREELVKMGVYAEISKANLPQFSGNSAALKSPANAGETTQNAPANAEESAQNADKSARATKYSSIPENSQTPLPENCTVLSSDEPTLQDLEDAFNDLWEAYPRKTGKGDAKRAFFRVVREEGVAAATIFYAVMEQSKSPEWKEDGGKFVPSLAKWLDGGRWEDRLSGSPEKKTAAPPAQLAPLPYDSIDEEAAAFRARMAADAKAAEASQKEAENG